MKKFAADLIIFLISYFVKQKAKLAQYCSSREPIFLHSFFLHITSRPSKDLSLMNFNSEFPCQCPKLINHFPSTSSASKDLCALPAPFGLVFRLFRSVVSFVINS